MKRMEWRFRDDPERFNHLEEWPSGPWDEEPDKVQWPDERTGLACLVVRSRFGDWCGYVGLPDGHPWRGLDYDDIPADVHGGLTYGPSPCSESETHVCHVVEDPSEDDVLWIGFDCHHFQDASPGMMASDKLLEEKLGWSRPPSPYGELHYWTLGEVQREVTALALQVSEAR